MDPFTWIALAVMIAGAATSFVGAQQTAKAQEEAGKAQQEAAAAEARNVELQTAENIKRERVNKRRRLARLRANLGTNGLVMGDSTEEAFLETAGRMELDIQDKARAGAMDAANTRSAGDMALWEARNAAIGTRISSYGTLLSDVSGAGSYGAKSGAFGSSVKAQA